MATYNVQPESTTVHGAFSRDFQPIIAIDSGDSVCFKTLDSSWILNPRKSPGEPVQKFEPRPKDYFGHALCGPIEICNAKPGMVLAVRINEIRPGSWGWSSAGGWDNKLNRRLGVSESPDVTWEWALDAETMTARSKFGDFNYKIRIRPFMGIMGMPPNESGIHSTVPPRFCGGNIDCKELIEGSTLFLPIAVPGGLFSVGDGHAVQGDGEVAHPALECPMERVDLTFFLRDDIQLTMPRARTPQGWITFGFHEDLNEACILAIEGMLNLMEELFGIGRKEALNLASLVVDLRITQIVNGVKGIHAILPHGAIR